MPGQLASIDDLIDIWPSAASLDGGRVDRLLSTASQKLRHACPFDIDARITLFGTDPTNDIALDPQVVADRVAVIVKRFLINPDGVASNSETVGPFSRSQSFVNRYDKTGADVRGEIRVIEEDIDELRPRVGFDAPVSVQVGIPTPEVLIPAGGRYAGARAGWVPVIVPDISSLVTDTDGNDQSERLPGE